MPRRLTSTVAGVEFFKLKREPADVDRVSVAREVAKIESFLRVRGAGERLARKRR